MVKKEKRELNRQLIPLKTALANGEIDRDLSKMHFKNYRGKELPKCEECFDLEAGECNGEFKDDPVECMKWQTRFHEKVRTPYGIEFVPREEILD